jgi:hypothetical protein
MRRLLSDETPVLATIALKGGLIDKLADRPGVTLWTLSRGNRDALVGEVVGWARDHVERRT